MSVQRRWLATLLPDNCDAQLAQINEYLPFFLHFGHFISLFASAESSFHEFFHSQCGLNESPARTLIGTQQIGKVTSVFTSTATQHGGQETTITSFHSTLLHLGMIIVGVPYSCQELMTMDEITGGSPYGAGTLAGVDGKRLPSENELKIARFQGRHVAGIAKKQRA